MKKNKKIIFQVGLFILIFTSLGVFFISKASASTAQTFSGVSHSCALNESGSVYCWGDNDNGQLGDDTTTDRYTPVQVLKGAAVSGDNDGTYLTNIKSVEAGYLGTCAVSNSDNIYCWGYNSYGQLGDNTTAERHTPVRVLKGAAVSGDNDGTYLTNIKSVSFGNFNQGEDAVHVCALSNNNNIYCWGYNNYGQLGDNTTNSRHIPVRVLKGAAVSGDNDGTYLTNIKYFEVGAISTCALSNNNNVYCWGWNAQGELGDGSTTSRYIPVKVAKGAAVSGDNDGTYLTNINSIGSGDFHTCAVSNNNNTYCWGMNYHGQLGDNSTTDKTSPIRVLKGAAVSGDNDGTYLTNISLISGGEYHTCALSNNNNVYCWGINTGGNVGSGSTSPSSIWIPSRVVKGAAASGDNDGTYLSNINSISAGGYHTCSVSNNNNVYCWGWNYNGVLGNNDEEGAYSSPVQVVGVDGSGYLDLGESTPLAPTISGVEDEGLYFDSVIPVTENGDATINGNPFTSGTTVTEEGTYIIVVDNGEQSVSVTFTILKNKIVYDPNPTKINEDYSLGIIDSEDPATATSEASLNVNYTLVSNGSSLYIPRNTVITPTEGGTMNINNLTATDIYETIHQENSNTKGAVEIGIPSQGLTFSQEVTVTLSVQPSYNGKVLTIYTRSDEEDDWNYHSTCSVSSGKCVFTTTHATQYMGYFEVSNSPTPTDVNVSIDATISLTCSDSVTMGTITGTGQSNLTTNEAACNVGTINSNGYQLSWQASTAYMENSEGSQIAPYSPTVPNIPETWSVESSASEWGARVKSTSTDPDLTSGGIWDDSDSYSGNWLNISTSPFVVANRSTETSQEGSNETIIFGAEIGSNKFQPTGTYDVDVIITATTL